MRRSSPISPAVCVGLAILASSAFAPRTARAGDDVGDTAQAAPHAKSLAPTEWDALNLGRAVDMWTRGDLRGAAELLEAIDISSASPFVEADRAAFLLANVYFRLDDAVAFQRVADRAADGNGSAYRRWIRYAQLLQQDGGPSAGARTDAAPPGDIPGATILSASLFLEMGRYDLALDLLEAEEPPTALASIHLYLSAVSREAIGADPSKYWKQLAKIKPRDANEADLVATALFRLAIRRLQKPGKADDAKKLLERVPGESRLAPRASHTLALIAVETGDTNRAQRMFAELIEDYPSYEGQRQVELSLGDLLMERGEWTEALARFETAEIEWQDEHHSLSRLDDPTALDGVWRAWDEQRAWRGELSLASDVLLADLDRLAIASLDLTRKPSLDPDERMADDLWPTDDRARDGVAASVDDDLSLHHPEPSEWDALDAARQRRRAAQAALARQERAIVKTQRDIDRRLDYLEHGHGKAAASADLLAGEAARLGDILARLDASLVQLEAVRDSAMLNVAARARDTIEAFRRDRLFIQAVTRFRVDGPRRKRPDEFPAGVPTPATILAMEDSLARETEALLAFFADRYPAVIARSFSEVWEPRLTGGSRSLHGALLAELDRARRLGLALDSTIAWRESDPALADALTRRDGLAARLDSLRGDEGELRRRIAVAVAARGRSQLREELEAIDYHLADASYELAVMAATDVETAEDSSVVAPAREGAVARLDTFLTRHPESVARGESRFRLADLRLMQARDDFQTKMAEFLGETPSADDLENRSLAPFVDYAPAVALFEAILAQDREFPHMDAVLFNLGMILSDDGRPAASDHLARLVGEYPDSPHCQEAWLRMGSDRFDRRDFAGCIPLFEHAAGGRDPSFAAIAYYKLGWAHFEEDRFDESADAFRRLMDLYGGNDDLAADMDLRDEAEEYLVHSLARAGGAEAFENYFDALGGRVYEDRVLMSLGHLMRGVSLYEEAVACDELWLARYPLHPKALPVSDRLVDTYKKWNKPDAARDAKLACAERFLPGGAWIRANDDDKRLRAAGEKFSQNAYRETAAHYHRRARDTEQGADWRLALSNYELYLAHWPDADDSPVVHHMAGEAAARLDGYARALSHFGAAARSDSAGLAIDADWQRVAVTDAWYRSSQPAGTEVPLGADSLAARILSVGDQFVARFPGDERCADVVWRQGNVAHAHGWYERSAAAFAQMGEHYPADSRAPLALRMGGDAHYQLAKFERAGAAYERAVVLAKDAGQDSLVAVLTTAIPLTYYKHAESVAASRGDDGDKEAAHLFARVAQRWPGFEHADLALYRAGLGFAARNDHRDAVDAWERLLAGYPDSDYARDSAVQVALVHEESGNAHAAARAYERFSRLHAADPDAPAALIKAADLLEGADDTAGAEEMRGVFLARFPGEVETVMEIRAQRAARELAGVDGGATTLASLLAAASSATTQDSDLKAYLALAADHPGLASPSILAQVDFVKAEEAYPAYASLRLTQPLPASIEKKQKRLEALLDSYDRCAGHGVTEYSRAAAHRIGQALIEFGDALAASERPTGLGDDDLLAYEEVLEEQSWGFYDRGEDVWSELLQQTGDATADPGGWIVRTREALWPRLAWRFLYQPEVDYPLVAATPPPREGAN